MPRENPAIPARAPASRGAPVRPNGCNVSELFAMLGQPHMLRLLSTLIEARPGALRFTEIQARLEVSPKTLSLRLRTLVEGGFATRRAFREIPPRVEYHPTAKLLQLSSLFDLLREWSEENTMHATSTVSIVGRLPRRAAARSS
jgi:DNA-binding HxlR family transcriptional regulator